MKPRIIKRQWIVWVLLLLPLSAAMALPTLWPRLHPSSSVSDLYRRYEHNPHIRATHLRNFQVNDTLSVDVTLLQANTDSAWCALMLDFGVPEELVELYLSDKEVYVGKGRHATINFSIDKNNPKKHVPLTDPHGYLVIGSYKTKTMSVFMTGDNNIKEIVKLVETTKLKKKNETEH